MVAWLSHCGPVVFEGFPFCVGLVACEMSSIVIVLGGVSDEHRIVSHSC